MTAYVFFLVLLSAFSHAAWNFAARKAAGSLMALWLGLWVGCAIISPGALGLIVHNGLRETVSPQGVICIVAQVIKNVYQPSTYYARDHAEKSKSIHAFR